MTIRPFIDKLMRRFFGAFMAWRDGEPPETKKLSFLKQILVYMMNGLSDAELEEVVSMLEKRQKKK